MGDNAAPQEAAMPTVRLERMHVTASDSEGKSLHVYPISINIPGPGVGICSFHPWGTAPKKQTGVNRLTRTHLAEATCFCWEERWICCCFFFVEVGKVHKCWYSAMNLCYLSIYLSIYLSRLSIYLSIYLSI